MNSESAYSFACKLLKNTQDGKIKWYPTQNKLHPSPFHDNAYSYKAKIKQGECFLVKNSYGDSNIRLYIAPEFGPTYDVSDLILWRDSKIISQYKTLLNELYKYIYCTHPNADKFISSFLED